MNPITRKSHQLIAPATALALFVGAIGTTMAAPVTVTNFSFESPDITGANVTGVPTSWSAPNGSTNIKYRDDYAPLAAGIPDGNQWALISFSSSNKGVTLAQNTGVTIVEGMTYTLTVAVGEQDNQATTDNIARIFLYGSTTGDTSPFALLDNIDPIPDANITAGDDSIWIDYQITFTATASQAGQSLVIGMGAGSNIGNGGAVTANVNFDNVRLYAGSIPSGSPVVYEPFDYTAASAVVGLNGGTGFGGAWTGAGTTINNVVGTGLGFGGLDVAGGSDLRSDRAGLGAISRTITGDAQTALTADNSTIWFSVLMDPTGGNGYAVNSYGTLIFGDTAFTTASASSAPPLPSGNAFGVGFVGEQVPSGSLFDCSLVGIQGVAYKGGTLSTAGDASVADVGDVVSFIVGRIDFAPTGSNDTLTLYHITDPTLGLPALPFATLSVDLNQSGFNVVSIGDGQTSVFDEIRIGTSYEDVVGSISSASLAISSFSYNSSTGASVASIVGAPTTTYILVEADDLDFGNPDQNPVPLTGATVGALDVTNTKVTTNGEGNATVQFNLGTAKPATFIRAQTAP